jgi:hypothetical protein
MYMDEWLAASAVASFIGGAMAKFGKLTQDGKNFTRSYSVTEEVA